MRPWTSSDEETLGLGPITIVKGKSRASCYHDRTRTRYIFLWNLYFQPLRAYIIMCSYTINTIVGLQSTRLIFSCVENIISLCTWITRDTSRLYAVARLEGTVGEGVLRCAFFQTNVNVLIFMFKRQRLIRWGKNDFKHFFFTIRKKFVSF